VDKLAISRPTKSAAHRLIESIHIHSLLFHFETRSFLTTFLHQSENDLLTTSTLNRLCPLLNGTMKQEEGFTEPAFAMGAPPAV